jgi:glycosyltransferase involved in cell wall biosynthesis
MSGSAEGKLTASVLLATYNRRALLPSVLEPVLGDPAASEIVVVVDGCEDGSLELLRAMANEDPRIKPQFIPNSGAARALLAGARQASGDVLVILDDDEIVDPGTITGHLRHHPGHENLIVVGYVEMAFPAARRPGDFSRYIYAHQYAQDCELYETDANTILRNLWGGYLSIGRVNYLRTMGSVNDFVDGYHYDLDFGARCMELGFRAVFDRSLRARHLYERDRAGFLRDARSSGRNRILVHGAHPTVLGPVDAGFVDAALPAVGRAALRMAMRYPLMERLVGAATTATGRLRLWRLETIGASLLWAIEQKRGALEALHSSSGLVP